MHTVFLRIELERVREVKEVESGENQEKRKFFYPDMLYHLSSLKRGVKVSLPSDSGSIGTTVCLESRISLLYIIQPDLGLGCSDPLPNFLECWAGIINAISAVFHPPLHSTQPHLTVGTETGQPLPGNTAIAEDICALNLVFGGRPTLGGFC